ncbi:MULTISPECIES: hypothetical protein [Vibrio harveyi group]|uniref:hypothetical protein n=1 Tax=Vibrio harveyi group TaxID=717610 RepID=UPI0015F57058|nr:MULTISPECIES: hypothetical protein [Vibrio harveyi group]MBD6945716.1 hypothetical protein [Vibrio parahaemolyticus]MBD6979015.1 hypothetical protein [Vibrio parahaemolyticus]MBD6991770.1 hypothetical protein [Vibrio parahaemolyticus]HBB9946522.1 hypothetical protein [Vibrio parahaemolyticus]
MSYVKALFNPWLLMLLVVVGSVWTNGSLKKELVQVEAKNVLANAQLATATTFNHSLNKTIESMSQQLRDAQLADDWMRQFNASMDTKLENTVLDLGKLFDEKPKDNRSGCDERFSDGVYERMLQHYNARKGDSVPD